MKAEKAASNLVFPFKLEPKKHSPYTFSPYLLTFDIDLENLLTTASIIQNAHRQHELTANLSVSHGYNSGDGRVSGYPFDSIHAGVDLSVLGDGFVQTSLILLHVARKGFRQILPVFPGFTVEIGEIVFTPQLNPDQFVWLQIYGRSLIKTLKETSA